MLGGGDGVDDGAGSIEDFDLEGTEQMPLALVIGDDRTVGGILTGEFCVAFDPAAVGVHPLLDGTCRNERRVLPQHLGGQARAGA